MGSFSWTPGNTQAGSYSVSFSVSDGSLNDAETVAITVGNVNRPPVLTAIGSKRTDGFLRKFSTLDLDIDLAAILLQLLDLRLLLDLKTLKYERSLEPWTIEHADKHADT